MQLHDGVVFVKRLTKLLKEFSAETGLTPGEFVSDKLKHDCGNKDFIGLCENFLKLMRHDKFFDKVVVNFWSHYGLKSFNRELIMTLMFIIIFGLSQDNYIDTFHIFTKLQYRFCFHVVDYFTVEDNLVDVAQAGCKFFDNDYVLEHILHPLLDKNDLIDKLWREVGQELKQRNLVIPKPVTKPVGPSLFKKIKPIPTAPMNTPAELEQFKSSEVPRRVLQGDVKVQESLEKARKENRERAAELLEFAINKAFKCANLPPKTLPSTEKPHVPIFKPTKVPPKKDVAVKKNAASLMREAAVFVKDKESEIKKLEALTHAVFNPELLETLEEDIRKCREQQHLQDIERKHLQGQLTYEESLLAKQNLLKANQEKMEEFKRERLAILEEIDLWRQKEQEKMKALVERSQNIEKAAKEAEKRMHETKKTQARLVEHETKELLRTAYEKKQEELVCKVRLIQELRALQQVRSLHVKEFDPTETPNFGLLCEMSIAELQERLALLKMELQDELDRRRRTIAESRQKQQQLIESVKQFIGQSREARPKPVPRSPLKLEQTPDLTALRERLQQARHNRISMQQSSAY